MRIWIQDVVKGPPVLAMAGPAALVLAAVEAGRALNLTSAPVATSWPAAGVLFALLALAPLRRWPLVLAGAVAAHVASGLLHAGDAALATADWAMWAISLAEAAASAALVRMVTGSNPFSLHTAREALAFIGIAAVGVPGAAALVAAAFAGPAPLAGFLEGAWLHWIADGLGVLLAAPLLLAERPRGFHWTRARQLEALLLCAACAGVLLLIMAAPAGRTYLVLPLLAWAAMRFDGGGGALVMAAFAATMLAATLRGGAPGGADDGLLAQVLALQPMLAVYAMSTVLTGALFREQQAARRAVAEVNTALEGRVAQRTAELARSDETARARLAELESIYGSVPVGLCVLDVDLRFVRINAALADMNGVPAGAHIGRSVREVLPEAADLVEPLLRAVLADGRPRRDVAVSGATPAQPGVQRQWIEQFLPLRDAGGRVVGVSVMCEEITERLRLQRRLADDVMQMQRAQQALADSERRFRTAVQAIQGLVYDRDLHTGRVYRSEGLRALAGFDPDEVPGDADWWDGRVHPADRERVRRALDGAVRDGCERVEIEYRVRHRDGHAVLVWDRAQLVRDDDGGVRRLVGSAVDVTASRRAASNLATLADASRLLGVARDRQRILAAVLDLVVPTHADGCLVHVAADGEPVSVSRHRDPDADAALRELGERHVPLAAGRHPVARVLRGEAQLLTGLAEGALDDVSSDEGERVLRRRMATHALILVPLAMAGRVLGFLAMGIGDPWRADAPPRLVAYDPRDLEFAEELGRRVALALDNARLYTHEQRALAELREHDRRRNEFLAMLGHELRNPLSPIRNAAELLQVLPPGDARLGRIAGVLQRQTGNMARLIDDLLDAARVTQGKVVLDRQPLRLQDVLPVVVEAVAAEAAPRGVRVALQMPEAPAWVSGDRLRLEQVFANLLHNAVKFSADGGGVWVTLRALPCPGGNDADAASTDAGPDAVEVEVRDEGVGIAADLLPRIFDLFTQGDRPLDRSGGGLGVGLALVKRLVDLHEGSVTAASDGRGRGARLTVRLPALAMPSRRVAAAPRPADAGVVDAAG